MIKPGDAAVTDDDDNDRYDAVLEDIPVLTSTTPLLSKGPPLPRTASKQRLVSYQHQHISIASTSSASEATVAAAECLVCLDTFTADNPCMPTLCACGEGKALFHYACLLTYLDEGKSSCPFCNRELYYEECDVK